jgi:tetratricopeptide (TPR) repeat protein
MFGPEHHNVASVLNSMSFLDFKQGRIEEAVARTERAVGIMARSLSPEHPNVMTLRGNLAMMLEDIPGREDEGRVMMREVADWRMRELGPENLTTWGTLQNVAVSYEEIGELDKALDLYTQIFEARKRLLPPGHNQTRLARQQIAGVLLSLSSVENKAGDLEKAKSLAADVIALYEDEPRSLDADQSARRLPRGSVSSSWQGFRRERIHAGHDRGGGF